MHMLFLVFVVCVWGTAVALMVIALRGQSVELFMALSRSLVLCRKDHEKAEFEVHEVYAVDVLISTGEGKVRDKHSLNIPVA